MREEIEQLEQEIVLHAKAYYEGESIIPDLQFDQLVNRLSKICPDSPVLTTGWGYVPTADGTVPHQFKMGSLPKVKVDPESNLDVLSTDFVTQKMDGVAVELVYNSSGDLVRAITRGDGTNGQDITSKVKHLAPNIEVVNTKLIPSDMDLTVRSIVAEVVMTNEVFLDNYSEDTHPRNVVAGILSKKEATEDSKLLSLVTHYIAKVRGTKGYLEFTHLDRAVGHQLMQDAGYATSPIIESGTYVPLDILKPLTPVDFNGVMKDVSSDGVVISTPISFLSGGEVQSSGSYAVKTITDTAISVVTDIEWNLSRTGKLIPLVRIEPVVLSGANIRRVAGHNYQYIVSQGVEVGSKVEIVRSGEIIPYILEVITTGNEVDSKVPTTCPSCNSSVIEVGVHLECSNPTCSGVHQKNLERYLLAVTEGIDNIGGAFAREYIRACNVKSVEEFHTHFHFPIEPKNATDMLIIDVSRRLMNVEDYRLILYGLGIEGLGWSSILKYGDDLFHYIVGDIDQLERPSHVSKVAHSYLIANREELTNLFLLAGVNIPQPVVELSDSESIIKVCLTGKLDGYSKRSDICKDNPQLVEVKVQDADYLVTNSSSETSKVRTAKSKGIPIITQVELMSILESKE